jgi:hypothetical protein
METIWLESCASSRAFSSTSSVPKLSFDSLKSRILDDHSVRDASEALSAASAIKLQASNLTSLLQNWDPTKLSEDKCRQLLSVLYGLEKEHLIQKKNCEAVTRGIWEGMEKSRLAALTRGGHHDAGGDGAGSSVSTASSTPSALIFASTNATILERTSLKHRVRSIRLAGSSGTSNGKPTADLFGLGQTFTDTNGIHCYKGQGSLKGKLVDCLTLIVPKTSPSQAMVSAWNCYAAHRSLALATTCVPHAVGVETDDTCVKFNYEFIPSFSLSSLLSNIRSAKPSFVLSESSPLFRHMIRETLISLSLLSSQSPHVLLSAHSLSPTNVMVSRQGTSVRLGRLLWGPVFDVSTGSPRAYFRERECALLKGFGRVLRTLLSPKADSEALKSFIPAQVVTFDVGKLVTEGGGGDDGDNQSIKVFTTSVQIGQRLSLILPPCTNVLSDLHKPAVWHNPILGSVGTAGNPPMYLESNTSMQGCLDVDVRGNGSCVLFATREGVCDIQIPCYDSDGKDKESRGSITIAVEILAQPCSNALSAILRACEKSVDETPEEGYTTLKGLLEHKYFEALGVGDLEEVMTDYERVFEGGKNMGGRSVL